MGNPTSPMDENNNTPTPEELQSEQEALTDAKADEVRAKVVSDLGLSDDETNKPVIDKIVERELTNRKKLSEAIGQKINWRTKALAPKPAQQVQHQPAQSVDAETIRKQTADDTRATLDQEYLDEKQYPAEIETEIKNWAKYKGISARKAESATHIKKMIEDAVSAGKIDEAAITHTPRSIPASQQGKMPKFDMSTDEGRKAFDDWKKANGK